MIIGVFVYQNKIYQYKYVVVKIINKEGLIYR